MDAALKVVVDIVNKDAIKKREKDVLDQTKAVQDLNKQFIQGTITAQQFGTAAIAAGDKIAAANRSIKDLGGTSFSTGRSLGQLSYAVDDIQYGFNAIVNNIPQIVMAMGGSFGLAGAIGIAAVAINQLMKNWGEMSAAMQGAWSGDSAQQILKIAERAEEAAKAFDKLAESASKAQKAQVSGVGETVTEAGTDAVANAIAADIARDPKFRKKFEEDQQRGAEMLGPGAAPRARKTREQIDREIGDAARKEAADTIGKTQKAGPEGEHARLELEKRLRAMGENGLANDVRNASPERQKEIAQKNLDLAGGRQGRKQEDKALADFKKADAAEKKDWLKEVEDAQKHLNAEAKKDRVNALEDQRTAILEKHHQEDLTLEAMKDKLGHGSKTLQGPKAVSDFYQKSMLDSPLVRLAQETKRIQEDQRTELKAINKQLEKERRVRPQN